jgi:hypothetical protein
LPGTGQAGFRLTNRIGNVDGLPGRSLKLVVCGGIRIYRTRRWAKCSVWSHSSPGKPPKQFGTTRNALKRHINHAKSLDISREV